MYEQQVAQGLSSMPQSCAVREPTHAERILHAHNRIDALEKAIASLTGQLAEVQNLMGEVIGVHPALPPTAAGRY